MNRQQGKLIFINPEIGERGASDPLSLARRQFIRRDFEGMIASLRPTLSDDTCSDDYKKACISNLAMACHVRGYYEDAKDFYNRCDHTIMKDINYYAFCHRYFEYKNICFTDRTQIRLNPILDHNKLNYILNVYGAERAIEFWGEKSVNLYDEQILNEIRSHQGEEIDVSQAMMLEKSYLEECGIVAVPLIKERRTIGIFITDLQRHKDSSLLYQLVDDLIQDYNIVIYFNNIFQNKLIKSFKEKVLVRDVSKLNTGEIIDLIHEDKISLLIDTAEYGLRNNHFSVVHCGIHVLPLSELLKACPILITSETYFSEFPKEPKKGSVLVLGDLRYTKDSELLLLAEKYGDRKLVFESQALDEPAFMNDFYKRLVKLHFTMKNVDLEKGVLPFSAYMSYVSSFDEIILIQAASNAEVSEAIKSRVPFKRLNDSNLQRFTIGSKDRLLRIIQRRIEMSDSQPDNGIKIVEDKILCYREENKDYLINCTCNGDLLIFDDCVENRNEYFASV